MKRTYVGVRVYSWRRDRQGVGARPEDADADQKKKLLENSESAIEKSCWWVWVWAHRASAGKSAALNEWGLVRACNTRACKHAFACTCTNRDRSSYIGQQRPMHTACMHESIVYVSMCALARKRARIYVHGMPAHPPVIFCGLHAYIALDYIDTGTWRGAWRTG